VTNSRQPEQVQVAPSGEFVVAIQRNGDVPIGVQLAWALRVRIAERGFEPGQRLPGLRDLAQAVGVNVNTVRAVYQRLEQEGLIETQQGSGTFVVEGPRNTAQVGAIAASAARKAHQAGVDPRQVAAALYVSSQPPSEAEQAAASRRAMLRTQITALQTALGELESSYPALARPSESPHPGPTGPRLLNAAELEQVRAQLVRRLATLQTAIDTLNTDEPAAQRQSRAEPRESPARKRSHKRAVNPAPARA
jgi:DNA-binding transcriptional regulator YhcF (GntR family)